MVTQNVRANDVRVFEIQPSWEISEVEAIFMLSEEGSPKQGTINRKGSKFHDHEGCGAQQPYAV